MCIGKSPNEIMWDMILNTVKKEALVNYTIVESYDFGCALKTEIAKANVKCDSIDEAKRFAVDQRRARNDLIEIIVNDQVVAHQACIFSEWIDK